jgi:hypothetical protein
MSDAAIAVSIGERTDLAQHRRVRLPSKLQITSQVEIIEAARRLAPWRQ